MSTYKQNKEFSESIFDSMLDKCIEWIAENMSPSDVFPEKDLKEWAQENCTPEEIFPSNELNQWALDNGFVKE